MPGIYNRARMTITGDAPSSGSVRLVAAVANYLTFDDAGILNAPALYAIHDGTARERGLGAYDSTSLLFDRHTCLDSTLGGRRIEPHELTAAAELMILTFTDDNPVGMVLDYAGLTEPVGWLFCYGQSVAVADYPALFEAIGYEFGGVASLFVIPDLRGRVVAGRDDMGGPSADRLVWGLGGVDGDDFGATGGLDTHLLTVAELPPHTHQTGISAVSVGAGVQARVTGTGHDISFTGLDQPFNIVQPTIILNKIIKAL